MKTTHIYSSGIARFGALIVTTLGLSLTGASADTSISIPLGGKLIGNGLTIKVDSGRARLDKATAYTYELKGNVSCPDASTTAMKFLVPTPISLRDLLNQFSDNGGDFLIGTRRNPGGTFPIKFIKKGINETVPTPLGNATVTFKFLAGVQGPPLDPTRRNLEGQVYFKLTNVNIVPPPVPVPVGTLKFDPGAELVITVKN